MNPYASFVKGQDVMKVISATPGKLRELMYSLGPDAVNLPRAPGKWCAREIVAHLADTELAFAFRLRQALAEPHHVIQPFDQDLWAKSYAAYSAAAALATFAAVRNWNLELVGTLKPEQLEKPVTHPERGQMTFRTILETMAGHDLNHLAQISELSARI